MVNIYINYLVLKLKIKNIFVGLIFALNHFVFIFAAAMTWRGSSVG